MGSLAEYGQVVTLLQKVFDTFDALSELYGVQKVRKTANECSIFAAGLPDTTLLPTPATRARGIAAFGFAMLASMHKLNVDLSRWGVTLRLQVHRAARRAVLCPLHHAVAADDACAK